MSAFNVAMESGKMQRSIAVAFGAVDIGARLNQQPHHVRVSLVGRAVQCRLPGIRVYRMNIGICLNEKPGGVGESIF